MMVFCVVVGIKDAVDGVGVGGGLTSEYLCRVPRLVDAVSDRPDVPMASQRQSMVSILDAIV